jgi:hypothetical protein
MIIHPIRLGLGKQCKLVAHFLASTQLWHRIEVIPELVHKANCRRFSSIKVDKNKPLGRYVGMNLEERVFLGLKIWEVVIFSCLVQVTIG